MSARPHGVVARFPSAGSFIEALRRVRAAGYTRVEANVPFAVEGMAALLPGGRTPVARVVLAAAIAGACGGFFLQWFAARDYPSDVGGRPLDSWPAFVPVTFELTVLTAALAGVLALLWLAGLPRLDHPIFSARGIERATQDRFFLCVRSDDPRFETGEACALLRALGAETIEEVLA